MYHRDYGGAGMLVQFTLKNVLSFKNETVLDMTAINAYKEHESNLIKSGNREKYLRVAAVYGANASGKSNLYKAMGYFKKIIAESLNNVNDGEGTALQKYYVPFSFESVRENSEYQIVMIIDDSEYKYGFEYNADCIVMEWLYRKNLSTNRTAIIFERTTNNVEFGASIRKECDIYKGQIPNETLVLSFFNKLKLKNDVFGTIYSGIMDTMVVPADFCDDYGMLQVLLPKTLKEQKSKFLEFLSAIDIGIKDISCDDSEKEIKFYTYHNGRDGNLYPLNLYHESEGTLKSIMLFIYARTAVLNDNSMFVDELNIKLHPLLLKFIIDLFYDGDSKAQLIYTTHDTTLMDKKFFRRDQILFVQKDEYGYSELSALSDFKVRSDASFEKDYLAGVYGGIPFIKDFDLKEGGVDGF
jgi:AAA15 family ATPase/GTPase